MYIFILPISGGGFVSQLAILQHLCEANIVPHLSLASSGGNVAAYIAAAANWKWSAIERISRELTQDLFAKPWSNVLSMSYIIGFFKGNVYTHGSGISDFLSKHFTPSSITKYEIWTGTYNSTQQHARLFCNKNKETSILDMECIDKELTRSMEPVYANGNIEIIAKSGLASASIPAVVPAQNIDDESHIDGGIAGASPLMIMQEPILNHVKNSKDSLHMIYVNSIDLSSKKSITCYNVVDTWKQATQNLILSQAIADRLTAHNLLRCNVNIGEKIYKDEFPCNYQNLMRVKYIQNTIKYSLLEIYPIYSRTINVVSFSGEDVVNCIRNTFGKCKCRLWWIQAEQPAMDHKNNNSDIYNILNECKSETSSHSTIYTSEKH